MKKNYREKIYSFVVPVLDTNLMAAQAIEFQEAAIGQKIDVQTVTQSDINHWTLNHIRHQVATYDRDSWSPSFQKDPHQYLKWFCLINRAIADKYPFLRKTASVQYTHKARAIDRFLAERKMAKLDTK